MRTDYHAHKCPKCGTIWQHSDNCTENDKAHKCPECGTEQFMMHPNPFGSFKAKGDYITYNGGSCRTKTSKPVWKKIKPIAYW